MKNKLIIGISGRAQAGKDTTADFLISRNIIDQKVSIADYLKEITSRLFNIRFSDLYLEKEKLSPVLVTPVLKQISNIENEIGTYLSNREVLQHFGATLRCFNPDCLIDSAIKSISQKSGNVFAIPDIRFPNEVYKIQKMGGFVIRLTRNPLNLSDISETMLDNFKKFDIVYDNENETKDETLTNIEKIISERLNDLSHL